MLPHVRLTAQCLLCATCLATIALHLPAAAAPNDRYIRIATFNIANFGDADEYKRSLIALTNVILETDADLIALQEVEPPERDVEARRGPGAAQVRRLTELLNIAAEHRHTPKYEYAVPADYTGDETVAFLYRPPVARDGPITLLPHDSDPDQDRKPAFQRVPHVAPFRAGNYDFLVVNAHLYTKIDGVSSEGRSDELAILAEWLAARRRAAEKDAIVLGDLNRFLYDDKTKAAWGRIYTANHVGKYRFPLLEAIRREAPSFDPRWDDAPEDRFSTTTSRGKRIYDQILISKGSFAEFTQQPRFSVDVGIVPFDDDPHYNWFIDDWNKATRMLSDHRPVWIRLRIDGPDDD